MLTAPSGRPASATISPTVSIVSGSLLGGLSTIEQPAAIAGASLWAARLSGKLNGLIAATGPIGKRRVIPSRPRDAAIRSSGITSPTIRSASSAPRRKVSVARSTSTSASRIGLPASRAISRPSSSRRALIPALIERRIAPRSKAGSRRVCSKAATAAVTAASYCSGVAWYVEPAGVPASAGLVTVRTSGESTQRPARKIGWGWAPMEVVMRSSCWLEAAILAGPVYDPGSPSRRPTPPGPVRHLARGAS